MAQTFAELLDAELKKRRMSGRALAEAMDINKMTVVRWRSGTHEPRHASIRAVASTLGIPVSNLFDGKAEGAALEAASAEETPQAAASVADEPAELIDRIAALDLETKVENLQQVVPDLMQVLADARAYTRQRRGK